jgi:gas vesicle protein
MDATTVGIIGAVVTVFSVLLTHWLGQRGGRERADQVRDELTSRLSGLDSRLTEVKGDLKDLIRDSKNDSLTAISQVRTELHGAIADAKNDSLSAIGQVRKELQGSMVRIEARIDAAKETYSRELNAMRTEILDAIPKRARQAASGEAER